MQTRMQPFGPAGQLGAGAGGEAFAQEHGEPGSGDQRQDHAHAGMGCERASTKAVKVTRFNQIELQDQGKACKRPVSGP